MQRKTSRRRTNLMIDWTHFTCTPKLYFGSAFDALETVTQEHAIRRL